jgi:hypothetical protein
MEDYARQHFDLLLQEAAGNLVDRAVHRCGGEPQALDRLQHDPEGEGVWLADFVDATFAEHLLDTPAGACFVLEALPRRSVPADPGGPVPEVLGRLARAAFGQVVAQQAAQALQRRMVFS